MGNETVEAENTTIQENVNENTQEVSAEAVQTAGISGSDLDLMAAIIECEAGGESYEGKIGVGAHGSVDLAHAAAGGDELRAQLIDRDAGDHGGGLTPLHAREGVELRGHSKLHGNFHGKGPPVDQS